MFSCRRVTGALGFVYCAFAHSPCEPKRNRYSPFIHIAFLYRRYTLHDDNDDSDRPQAPRQRNQSLMHELTVRLIYYIFIINYFHVISSPLRDSFLADVCRLCILCGITGFIFFSCGVFFLALTAHIGETKPLRLCCIRYVWLKLHTGSLFGRLFPARPRVNAWSKSSA